MKGQTVDWTMGLMKRKDGVIPKYQTQNFVFEVKIKPLLRAKSFDGPTSFNVKTPIADFNKTNMAAGVGWHNCKSILNFWKYLARKCHQFLN